MVYCNTLTIHSSSSLAIQFSSLLQYNFFFLAFKPSYCNTNQAKPPAHVTIHQVYCDTTSPTKQPSSPLYCNTICILLQYKPIQLHTQCCNIILLLQDTSNHSTAFLLQYNCSYHNTIWAIAQISLHFFFRFPFFSLLLILIIFFSFFPTTGKHQKIYIYLFFFSFSIILK